MGRQAELIEDIGKNGSDLGGFATFDLAAVEHKDGPTILEKRHRGRRWREVGESRAQTSYSGFVGAGENRSYLGGT